MSSVPPWLGIPSCLALGSDGHSICVGSLSGGLLVYDLRFLAPWKQWRVSSGAAILSMKSASFGPSPGAFVSLGSDCNEVALFDVVRGSCLTLFLTEPVAHRQREAAVSVPTLLQAAAAALPSPGGAASAEWQRLPAPDARRSAGSVRSLWLPSRGAQTYVLAGGADRRVRHWSLDPEHHAAEAYVVTPPDPSERGQGRAAYSSNQLGDVLVVREQAPLPRGCSGARQAPPKGASAAAAAGSDAEDARGPTGANPNHRDAILDLCSISLQQDLLVTAGRDGLVKLWR